LARKFYGHIGAMNAG